MHNFTRMHSHTFSNIKSVERHTHNAHTKTVMDPPNQYSDLYHYLPGQ